VPALIAIEVSAPEPERSQWVASMLEACNAALEGETCVYAVERNASFERAAEVTWTAPDKATITFREARSGRTLTRTLHFQSHDEPREKWRMVGFTTALLAGSHEHEAPPPQTSSHDPRSEVFHAVVSARALGATGLNQRPPKLGAQLRIDARAWESPWLLGLSGEFSRTEWNTPGVDGEATWGELGFGGTVMWYPSENLQLFTRIDLLAQRLVMMGTKKKDQDEAQLWQPGLRLALDLHWPLVARWYAVLGAQSTIVVAPVALEVDDKLVERAPAASVGLNAGVQYRF
jgi:hypothetical protein